MKQRIAVLLMLGLMPWAGPHAQSQAVSAAFKVQARVEAVCEVKASDLDLAKGTLLMHASCTPDSIDKFAYQINSDAARSRLTVRAGLEPDSAVFSGVPAVQVLPAGGHADAITVRVYY